MDIERQYVIDKSLGQMKAYFLQHVIATSKEKDEAVYATCCLMLDFALMHYKAIKNCVPQQEAKAAFKISLDSLLVEHGMSVAIHEFV